MKKCIKCNIKKELIYFSFRKDTNRYRTNCKECCIKKSNEWRLDNKEKLKQYNKQYYLDNKEYFKQYNKEYFKQYRLDNKEKFKEKQKQYYLDNKEKFKQYRLDNIESIKERVKKYHLDNKEYFKEYNKQYHLDNKEKIKQHYLDNKKKINQQSAYYAFKKRKTNPLFKLSINLRSRIKQAVKSKGWTKKNKTADILGCDFETVKKHLENQFIDGMCWQNHGLYGWHIDHITPLAKAETEEELYKLCHYTNLQPLWAADNLSKGAKEL